MPPRHGNPQRLDTDPPATEIAIMKSVSVKRFYSDSGIMDSLPDGEHLAVKSGGKTEFIVIKGGRPQMTAEIAHLRAVGAEKGAKFDGTAFLRSLKK